MISESSDKKRHCHQNKFEYFFHAIDLSITFFKVQNKKSFPDKTNLTGKPTFILIILGKCLFYFKFIKAFPVYSDHITLRNKRIGINVFYQTENVE